MIEGFGVHSFRLLNAPANRPSSVPLGPKLACSPPSGRDRQDSGRIRTTTAATCSRPRGREFPDGYSRSKVHAEGSGPIPFDHLDATKLIPEELVPLKVIGRMVLDRWPNNFFAETEQVAYCPANIVPGIDFSNDPLLQGRLFSYLDTQLSRLGSPNFHQSPINAPKCPFTNLQRDGHMQMAHRRAGTYYPLPSGNSPRETPNRAFKALRKPKPVRRPHRESFADHYSQARQFYRSKNSYEQGAHRLGVWC